MYKLVHIERGVQRLADNYVIEMLHITKEFPGIKANDDITLQLRKGEIHALLGENGAGKSTLMSVLFGLYQPEQGTIKKNGKEVKINNPNDANALGIGMVHQHFKLVECFTVLDNIILGVEDTKHGFLQKDEARKKVMALSEKYGLKVDPDALVSDISVGMQQRVEILKMLYRDNEILIFDEPTALLTPQESDALFDVLRRLRELGKSTIFITHKLREVYQIADRMTVIRQGRIIGTTTPQETGMEKLTQMMVGKTVPTGRRRPHPIGAEEVLQVKDLSVQSRGGAAVQNATFSIRSGEVLGVAGIEGNGQTPLAQALLGLCRPSSGSILLDGREITGRTTKQIRDAGVGSIPDDRQGMGLILSMRLFENMLLNAYDEKPYAKSPLLEDWAAARRAAQAKIADYSIAATNESVVVGTLSGGNQQKIVVARELDRGCRMLIAAQPTRGVDIASADYIQGRILAAAEQGCAVLLISSDLDELIKVSDRIMVLFRGQIMGFVDADNATREALGRMMLGEAH